MIIFSTKIVMGSFVGGVMLKFSQTSTNQGENIGVKKQIMKDGVRQDKIKLKNEN